MSAEESMSVSAWLKPSDVLRMKAKANESNWITRSARAANARFTTCRRKFHADPLFTNVDGHGARECGALQEKVVKM